jgi:hypothetical protein
MVLSFSEGPRAVARLRLLPGHRLPPPAKVKRASRDLHPNCVTAVARIPFGGFTPLRSSRHLGTRRGSRLSRGFVPRHIFCVAPGPGPHAWDRIEALTLLEVRLCSPKPPSNCSGTSRCKQLYRPRHGRGRNSLPLHLLVRQAFYGSCRSVSSNARSEIVSPGNASQIKHTFSDLNRIKVYANRKTHSCHYATKPNRCYRAAGKPSVGSTVPFVASVDVSEARHTTTPSMAGTRRRTWIDALSIRFPAYRHADVRNDVVP